MLLNKIFFVFQFIKHNKKIFRKKILNTKNITLIENFDHKPSIIAFSYFSNILADIHNAKLIIYNVDFFNLKTFIKHYFSKIFFLGNYNIYKSFNVIDNVIPNKIYNQNFVDKLYFQNLKKIKNKKKILKINFLNIKVGDLIYDEYLRKYNLPTIKFNSEHFRKYLYSFTQLFVFWYMYFKNNKVKAVIASHTVYATGLVPRIAIYKKVKTYNMSSSYVYNLSKKNYLRLSGFENYKNDFLKIKNYLKKDLAKIAERILSRKISGKDFAVHNRISNIPNTAFGRHSHSIINHKSKEKILIASHCFTDAVHAFGDALFSDFYEWMDYLGKLSNKLNYEWIIKIHPSQYDLNIEKMNYFTKKYKKFHLLPKLITHNQIIAENKILCVLTVYGSVGHEYPLFGIPVINASANNPHMAYSFNYNPSSIKKYEYLIKNVKNLKNNFYNYKKEIYEYYYIRIMSEYHLFKNPQKILNKLGKNYSSSLIFNEWLKQFNIKLHQKRICDYKKFIKSNKFRMIADNTKNNSDYLDF
jgi:hypothetical protein